MANTSTGCTFGGKDLIIPDPADGRFDYALRVGANSFTCPVGPEPGRGWIVMERADLEKLTLADPHELKWRGLIAKDRTVKGERTLTLKNLYIVNDPIRIDTTGDDAPGSLYLVEITDVRFLAKHFSSINAAYNLRKPGPPYGAAGEDEDRYYTSTLNAGAFWTWDTLCENIWEDTALEDMLGAYPGLPYTPTGTPEDMRFVGVTAWWALHHVLDQIGCTTALDPTQDDGAFSIVQLGETQAGLAAKEDKYDEACPRMHSFDPQAAKATRIPETIRVHFRYRHENGPDGWTTLAYTVDKATGVAGVVAGSVLPIWDSMPARYDAGTATLSNSAALSTRATEVKDNWLAIHNVSRGRKVYGGIVADILPGEEVRAVEWRNGGDTWRTTVIKRPELCVDLWPTKFANPVTLERLHSVEHWVRFELTDDLVPGGTATAYVTMFRAAAWESDATDGGTAEIVVYDNIGDKTAFIGDFGWALWSMESQQYEVIQVSCP